MWMDQKIKVNDFYSTPIYKYKLDNRKSILDFSYLKHKAILGYPWFTAFQPCINWKQGWIDTMQLPIIFSAPNV